MDRSAKAAKAKGTADAPLRHLSDKYVRGAERPLSEPASSVVSELRCQSARTLFRLRDEFIASGRPDARTALSGAYRKAKLVERLAGLVVAPETPVTPSESTRALALLQRRLHQAESAGNTTAAEALKESVEAARWNNYALKLAWSGPTRDVTTHLPEELEARVRAHMRGEPDLPQTEDALHQLTVALAELPYAILDNLERRMRNASPPKQFPSYRPTRTRESKIRNVVGLLLGLEGPQAVTLPTSADAAKREMEAEQALLPASAPDTARLQRLKLLECELREAEGKHQGWRYDLGVSIEPPRKLSWLHALLSINLETHHFGQETCRYLTVYLSYPSPANPFSTGLSIPLSQGWPSWKDLKPSARAGYFGWGRWGPLGQLPFEDAALTAEGGDMLGFTLGTKALKRLRMPGSDRLAPPVPLLGRVYPMVGIFRRSPFLGETHVGNFFRKLADGGDRINRAIQDAFYSSFKWATDRGVASGAREHRPPSREALPAFATPEHRSQSE